MTPAEKDAAVLRVLRKATDSMTPLLIADLARFNGSAMTDDSVLRALKRIGAEWHPGGRYSAPAAPAERPKALPPFNCCACHRRVAEYAGSRAEGEGRRCSECVKARL